MNVTKILETSINIFNPNELFQHNFNDLLIQKLTKRYKNRCYQSIYVLKINKIIRRSSIKLSMSRLDGSGDISVQFEVDGIVLIENSILHNCKILKIHTNAITAEHEYVGIKLQKSQSNKISQVLQVDQIVSVIVNQVRYITNKKKITMIATPYMPVQTIEELVIYNILSGITQEESDKVKLFLDKIKEEESLHDKIKKEKRYSFFQDMMYPYKVNHKFEREGISEHYKLKPVNLTLKEILAIKSGILIYSDLDHRSHKRVFVGPSITNQLDNDEFIIDSDLFPIIMNCLNKYLFYLRGLRGFVETYNTPELMKKQIAHWHIMKMTKA